MRIRWALLLVVMLSSCSKEIREEDIFRQRKIHVFSNSVHRKNVVLQMGEVLLRGWRLTPQKPRYQMIYFCGIGMNVAREAAKLYWLAEFLDLDILAFDYPGYGFSDGTASVETLRTASLTIFDAMKSTQVDPQKPIFIYGHSLGTAAAVWVGIHRENLALILEAPFTSAQDYFDAAMDQIPWPISWFICFDLDEKLTKPKQPVELIKDLQRPLLIVHGDQDPGVPVEHAMRMFRNAGTHDKHWCLIPDTGHFPIRPDRDNPPPLGCLVAFLKAYGGEPPPPIRLQPY